MSEAASVDLDDDNWSRVTDRPLVDSAVVIERVDGGELPGVIDAILEYKGESEQVMIDTDEGEVITNPDRVELI
jgi:hypothetical protein